MPEFGFDCIDIAPTLLADPALEFRLTENSCRDLYTACSNNKSLTTNPVTTVALQVSPAVLPAWATRYAAELQNIPWFQFLALVHPIGMFICYRYELIINSIRANNY